MENTYFAQPYNIDARGFFFADADDYKAKRKGCFDRFGQPVEEFELAYVGDSDIDAALFDALAVNQATIMAFMARLSDWNDDQKIRLIIVVGEGGYSFDIGNGDVDDLDIDLYQDTQISDLAYQFVDEGLFGDIPDRLASYIDYEAIARDLAFDYTETVIAGVSLVYRLA